MKIGILTFHFTFNQGAVLQCYAMQKYLESLGHEAYVINYRPKYHTIMHSAWRNPFIYSHVFWKKFSNCRAASRLYLTARSFARCMYWNLTGADKKNQSAFRLFEEKNLHLTKEYRSLKELQLSPPEMDAYICGSDQVWNPDLLGSKFDRVYFLDFGDKKTTRIAYAASIGMTLEPEMRSQLYGLCKDFNAVSLREYSEKDIAATGRDVHVCIDPTFLLDAEDYIEVESNYIEDSPYIFVYGFETNDMLRSAVEDAVRKYNCRIINGSPKWLHLEGNVETISGYGPDRFLSLIKNANCVITNSFHGTAFSVIYKKDFITVSHTTRGKRMQDLLGKLGLFCRLYGSRDYSLEKPIDYTDVYEKLNVLKTHSKEYLALSLSGQSGESIPHYPEETVGGEKTEENIKAFYGFYKNEDKLKKSASGGAATVLSEKILQENGVVFGAAFSDDFKSAEFRCVESPEELDLLKGSKYISPKTYIDGKLIYDVVGEKLEQGKTVLFVGSGCHIGALRSRLEKKQISAEHLYTVDLICHGPTIQPVYDAFLTSLEEKYRSKAVSVNMRKKEKGWVPPYFQVEFENGKRYSRRLYETDFGFALRVCVRESCYQCVFKGKGHIADITVGDFWGLKPGMAEYNKDGVSVFISRSEKGERLINSIDRESFFLEKTDPDRVFKYNRMYGTSVKKPGYVEKFKTDMQEKGLRYAVVHSKGYPDFVKLTVKNRIKKMLGMQ